MSIKTVLITGGSGYIGKICQYYLKQFDYDIYTIDDLSSGNSPLSIERFSEVSVLDIEALRTIFQHNSFDAVIHLASRIQVAESVKLPLLYYQTNVTGLINLLQVMHEFNTHRLIFASSAAVYGCAESNPITECTNVQPINPYGHSKLLAEQIINDAQQMGFLPVILRLFNVAGALPKQQLGECHDPETHLIPLTIQRCIQKLPINIFGQQYPTVDGTCVRDYIHVLDVVRAIHLALEALLNNRGMGTYNLGSSIGSSVLEVINKASSLLRVTPTIDWKSNRPGDPPILLASTNKIQQEFGWSPLHSSVENILASTIEYQLL